MSTTIRILAFAGSTREASLNKKLAKFAAASAGDAGATVTWIDLRDYPIPLYDGDWEERYGQPPAALRLRTLFNKHDALLIASPEYNGFFSPLLKNVFDWLSRPCEGVERHAAFKHKPVLLLAATRGESGGGRGLKQLRLLLNNLKAQVHESEYLLPKAVDAFDEYGELVHEEDRIRLILLLQNFVVRADQLVSATT